MRLFAILLLVAQAADLDALRKKFEDEKNLAAPQRAATIAAIGAVKTDDAAKLLEQAFDQEKEHAVRAQALKALVDCATDGAHRKLAKVAGDTAAPLAFRAPALQGILEHKTKEGLALVRSVAREQSELRLTAFGGLRHYPLGESEPLWRDALKDADPMVRGMALAALAPLKDLKLEDFARKALLDPNADMPVKYGSVEVLRVQGGAFNARLLIESAKGSDLTLRRLLSEALGSFADEKSVQDLYAALRHNDAGVRAAAARALGRLKHPKAGDKLEEPLKDRSLEVRAAALEAVAERRDKNSEAILQKEAQRSDEETAAAAIALLPGYPSDATRQLLLKLAASHKAGIAISALEALGELRTPEALPVFEKALASKEWPVRVVAIRGVGKLKLKESVDLLVERMAKEEGRLLAECGDALRALTGKQIGYAAGGWKEWWTANRDAFAFAEKTAAAAPGDARMTTYHGVPVLSNRLVFCTDISGSMSEIADTKESRLDQAKKELSRVLSSLGKDAHVNLIFFDDRIEPWKQQMVPVKPNLAQALQIIAAVKPRGRTNIFDALALAFMHREVDTIYLLSDGEPTDGKIVAPEDILREVRKLNRQRQIVIHAISFGASPFMRALAEQNGGQYVEIR